MAKLIAGIDGCPSGWIAAIAKPDGTDLSIALFHDISSFWECHGDKLMSVLIDMPIGLATAHQPTREFDEQARSILKGRLASRIFTPPIREAISCTNYTEACTISSKLIGKAFSKQAWNITPKIRELDAFLNINTKAHSVIKEGHPELAFAKLNDGHPVLPSKKTESGREQRLQLLQMVIPNAREYYAHALQNHLRRDVARDDIIDAFSLLAVML